MRVKSGRYPLVASAFVALAQSYLTDSVWINSSSSPAVRSNKKAHSSRVRTKGHNFAVPPHFAGRCRTGALVTLTVLRRDLSGLAITGLPVPIYFAPVTAHFFNSQA